MEFSNGAARFSAVFLKMNGEIFTPEVNINLLIVSTNSENFPGVWRTKF
jgi:hypothetical protein